MPINLLMPALSPTMTEGKLSKWLKKEGDKVKSGDAIAEIETDKATMEFEAVDEGILGKILVAEGTEGVAVNTPIGIILEEGEDASSIREAKPIAAPAPAPAPAAAAPSPAPAPSPVPFSAPAPSPAPSSAPAPADKGDRVFATPLAKRIASDANIDLKSLKGSGPHGRIIKADVEFAKQQPGPAKAVAAAGPAIGTAPAAAPKPAAPAPAHGPAYEDVPLSSIRKVIARRLTEAKQTVPHFYLTIDYKLDALLALRTQLNAKSDTKLSVNDFIIRASALALKKVPAANASFTDTALRMYKDIDISVAVATPTGLITPIIKHADQKGLAQISAEMKELAGRAKEGKLKPQEFQGGTFSISNLGMFGIKDFAAIINPPQGCILAVGAGEQRPVVADGALAIATVMSCTLSVDHRVVDGAVGAEYLAALKGLIEDPITMLL